MVNRETLLIDEEQEQILLIGKKNVSCWLSINLLYISSLQRLSRTIN